MQAHHHVMKIRGDINAVSEGLDGGHALLAAFLEATGKIDRRALQKRGALSDAPEAVNLEPINLEALPTPVEANPALLEASPTLLEANLTLLEARPALLEASPPLLEVSPTSTAPKSRIAPFAFRRANLVRA